MCDPEWYEAVEENVTASRKEPDFGNKKLVAQRKRNRVNRHGCRARMAVVLRDGKWEVTVFEEQHTHPMMSRGNGQGFTDLIGRYRMRTTCF